MSGISFDGLDELMLSMQEVAELPESVQDEMLNAQADVVAEAQRAEAMKLSAMLYPSTHGNTRNTSATNHLPGQVRSFSTGETARSIKKGKPKTKNGTRVIYVTPTGSRKRGKQRIRNAEIAFYNEYGTRTINARRFIWMANEKSAEAATEAAFNVYDKYLKSKNL